MYLSDSSETFFVMSDKMGGHAYGFVGAGLIFSGTKAKEQKIPPKNAFRGLEKTSCVEIR